VKLNLETEHDRNKAAEYLATLTKRKAFIELKEVKKSRTNRQNAYLHAMIAEWAMQAGYTLEEMKYAIKAALGYTYEKKGVVMYRPTSAMDSGELTTFIDKMRMLSAEYGVDLMSAEQFERGGWKDIEKRKQAMKAYL